MRKAIYLLAALALFGCNMAEYAPVEPENYSIQATMEREETKTSVSDNGYFTWSTGDKIWLHTTNGGVEGVLSAGAGTSNATFTYGPYVGSMTGKSVYPYGNHSIKESTLTVTLPESYDLGANTDNTNAAMYAVVADGTLQFTHLAGVMRFEFKSAPVGTSQFKITLDKKINGKFTADLTADYPTLAVGEASTDAEKTVTINFTPLEESKDLRLYVPLPIGTYGSLALELNAGEQNVWTYSKEVSNTINRKTLLLMPAISMGGSIGGDIENDGSIGGDIDNGDNGELYIKFEDGSTYKDLGVKGASGGYMTAVSLDTNVETGFDIECANDWNWIYAYVYSNKLNVQLYKNKGFARSATIKISPKGNNDAYVEVKVAQESAIEETMAFNKYSQLGSGGNGYVKNVNSTLNSLDFVVGVEQGEGTIAYGMHGLYFNTNVSDYQLIIPEEDKSWIGHSGVDYANDIFVICPISNEGLKRSSALEVTCPHTGKVFYTINVIQEANPAAYVDLSANGTANCYIVSEAGAYKFAPTKGNTNTSVGSISSVEVLWESRGTGVQSVGSLVPEVSYNNGYINFITPDTFEEGNAVIAAKNSAGKVLWSWHIWLTDAPKEHVYGTYGSMMDRNLGALSSAIEEYNTAGLLYQWGRKDPFMGAYSMSANNAVKKGSSATWPSPVASSSTTGTIEYATENPMTFITANDQNYDWYYTGDSSKDCARWSNVKTEYDPCPTGWRVPDGGDDGIWNKSTFSKSWNYTYHSIYFWIGDDKVCYPAAPTLSGSSGNIYQPEEAAGWSGYYWTCTPKQSSSSSYIYRLHILYPGYFFPTDTTSSPASGYSVRCQKVQ